ncbi:SDR family oxidoreductase [Rhodovastum atsumiense]|uniref:SDR family oxidoreductase n=1 Tax=Rhodovastum atsumiense TaxID=504468 RepID=A0A5M6ILU4_9PROT|nr:SDR family oxidoreductase [Rhodovastum atsumiense]KAA5608535.1 SDR family oxidoreductase [Rhodovastum atsumiense]CAH2599995.1 SDR family oxidoreductase [Rhodovastum atsumiense]
MTTPHVALVTGGSSGIGAEICRQLLQAGTEVVSLARRAPSWQHPRLHAVTADLMDTTATRQVAAELASRFQITHVIHNASALRPDPLEEMKLQDLGALVQLHLAAPVLLVQAALPAMKGAKFGRIVLLSSRAALGQPTRSADSATRAGLIGMARTWALELAPHGITVNVVAPGPIAGASPFQETAPSGIPVGRPGTAADVARAVLFFAAAENGFVTGQTLFVCGGTSVGSAPI